MVYQTTYRHSQNNLLMGCVYVLQYVSIFCSHALIGFFHTQMFTFHTVSCFCRTSICTVDFKFVWLFHLMAPFHHLSARHPIIWHVCWQILSGGKNAVARKFIGLLSPAQVFAYQWSETCTTSRILSQIADADKPSLHKVLGGRESMDHLYPKSLDGFLMIITSSGDMTYLSENVSHYLGLTQVETDTRLVYHKTWPIWGFYYFPLLKAISWP